MNIFNDVKNDFKKNDIEKLEAIGDLLRKTQTIDSPVLNIDILDCLKICTNFKFFYIEPYVYKLFYKDKYYFFDVLARTIRRI